MTNRNNLMGLLSAIFLILLNVSYSYQSVSNFATISAPSLRKSFEAAKPYSDLSNAFYSIKGLQLLGESLSQQTHQDVCNFVKSKVDKTSLESIYYATSLAALINCQLTTADFQAALNAATTTTNIPDLYYYSFISQNLQLPVDTKKLLKSLTDGLRSDSSILNQAYSLHIAALLPDGNKPFYDNIEDILDQADEVDKKFLQYEGGVGTTSLVLEGIFLLSDRFKQLPAKFDQQRLAKFVNYLSSKRFPTNIKSAYFLLRTTIKLADNQFAVPVILNRLSPVSVSASSPNALVSLTNLLGGPIKQTQFDVEAQSAKSQKNSLFAAKKAFTPKSSDGTTYELRLLEQNQQPVADFYLVTVSVQSKPAGDKRFFLVQNTFEVKVTTSVSLVDVQIGVADREQSAQKLIKVEENSKLKDRLDADQQSKLYLKFGVKDKSKSNLVEVHQAFVKFTEAKSGREIIFLAQAGLNNLYSAEIDFSTNSKNFLHHSGVYSVELIVSDALVENSVSWQLAEVKIQFAEDQAQSASSVQDKASLYAPRPEIKHLFRQPEVTPPVFLSTLFAVLSLLPLVLLVVLWFAIGFNLSRFSFSISGLIFHLTIAAIFGLFYLYWVKLNMFQTARYLAVLGLVALFSGNTLLKSLALNKEKKN